MMLSAGRGILSAVHRNRTCSKSQYGAVPSNHHPAPPPSPTCPAPVPASTTGERRESTEGPALTLNSQQILFTPPALCHGSGLVASGQTGFAPIGGTVFPPFLQDDMRHGLTRPESLLNLVYQYRYQLVPGPPFQRCRFPAPSPPTYRQDVPPSSPMDADNENV